MPWRSGLTRQNGDCHELRFDGAVRPEHAFDDVFWRQTGPHLGEVRPYFATLLTYLVAGQACGRGSKEDGSSAPGVAVRLRVGNQILDQRGTVRDFATRVELEL
jgi:hypothetical protein